MPTNLTLKIAGDIASAEALLNSAAPCGPTALWRWLAEHVVVQLPDEREDSALVVESDSPPGPDSEAKVWVDLTFGFVAVRSDQGWVIRGSREGMLNVFSPETVVDHTRKNEYLVRLTEAEKTALGLTGDWGRYTLPQRKGVIYS